MGTTVSDLENLYRSRYFGFRNSLATITGDQQSAHDVVQEAFARALSQQERFRDEGSLAAWVWRIAYHLALRSRRRFLSLPFEFDLDASIPEPQLHPELAAGLRRLPSRQRLIVFLRYFADFDYEEIAQACGVSVGTVGAALSKARETLRGELSGDRNAKPNDLEAVG